ncbi:UNVERIFIED_CONTAM: hypothetical protein RMT77_014981 [Armadillidium vulgare]
MSYKCSAHSCTSKYFRYKPVNISFFTFPIERKEFCEWADLCHRPDLKEKYVFVTKKKNQKYRLCEKHFRSGDIYQLGSKKCIRKNALPIEIRLEKPVDFCEIKLEPRYALFLEGETNLFQIYEDINEPDFKIKFVNIPRIIKNNSINFVDVAASKLDLPKKFEHTKNEDPLSGTQEELSLVDIKSELEFTDEFLSEVNEESNQEPSVHCFSTNEILYEVKIEPIDEPLGQDFLQKKLS